MQAKDKIEVWGKEKEIRDFLYIDDLIDFIKKLYKNKNLYEIYNCGSGKPITIKELCKLIVKISNKKYRTKI